ncbi:MAG: 16S rRNA (guanine(966)-N(2))-methyltransferase RsmD [Candidatus Omnitrophica bacterium]|nr:16S rRNA (guanine(966)-N(2))-methyltransferase RsmD [Candidatus Omnitrophota bacterium]
MRIIGGKYRGRKIRYPKFAQVRPTKDRVREAVFSMIAEWIPGARVLDLFSGSGSYGLEAVSRGAASVLFVEENEQCARAIRENIDTLDCLEQTLIASRDVFEKLAALGSAGTEKFDLIFADPPFRQDIAKKTLLEVNNYDIVNRSGLLIVEHHTGEALQEIEGYITLLKQKTYKDISISIFTRK